MTQEIYDQNKNLDNAIYTVSTGARWEATGVTGGEIFVGYQFLNLLTPKLISRLLCLANIREMKILLKTYLLPVRYIGFHFGINRHPAAIPNYPTNRCGRNIIFYRTGVNLTAVRELTERMDFTVNLGYERDDFSTPAGATASTPPRTDELKNAAIGLNYRAVKWIGVACNMYSRIETPMSVNFNIRPTLPWYPSRFSFKFERADRHALRHALMWEHHLLCP